MRRFNKITIIGVGLMGGSIGLAIKKKGMAREVAGVFRHEKTLKKALKRKAIDKGYMNIKDGVRGADLVILATPVSSIVRIARETVKYAGKKAVITDVGSTKEWIVAKLERSFKGSSVYFIGSHPMAGSEHNGVEFARDSLLEEAPCIVTKTGCTDNSALSKV
jgi:prephenate dehydrogenase